MNCAILKFLEKLRRNCFGKITSKKLNSEFTITFTLCHEDFTLFSFLLLVMFLFLKKVIVYEVILRFNYCHSKVV
jgi:hypothetical protein